MIARHFSDGSKSPTAASPMPIRTHTALYLIILHAPLAASSGAIASTLFPAAIRDKPRIACDDYCVFTAYLLRIRLGGVRLQPAAHEFQFARPVPADPLLTEGAEEEGHGFVQPAHAFDALL
jgi:hypothetical protein